MKPHKFRSLALPGILLACIAASQAQVTIPSKKPGTTPSLTRPTAPIVVRPTTPVKPTNNGPAATRPTTTVTPVKPVAPAPTVIVVPSYPSAYIGPTIIRTTRSEPVPATPQSQVQPLPTAVQPPPHRLVALLGQIKRHDVTSGSVIEIGDDRLCITTGALVGHVNERGGYTFRALGDFFGHCWDGDRFKTSEDWKRGPFLDHPILTLNGASPSTWEFETAVAGRRMGWMRLAVALFEYDPPSAPDTGSVVFPRGRRASMGTALSRIRWEEQRVTGRAAGMSPTDASLGADVSHFGKALEMFASRSMTPSMDNDRIGIAEWFFTPDEINTILAACPKFDTEMPTGARLREVRAAERAGAPVWVRTFDRRGDHARYTGEVWFIVVPDAALSMWLDAARR